MATLFKKLMFSAGLCAGLALSAQAALADRYGDHGHDSDFHSGRGFHGDGFRGDRFRGGFGVYIDPGYTSYGPGYGYDPGYYGPAPAYAPNYDEGVAPPYVQGYIPPPGIYAPAPADSPSAPVSSIDESNCHDYQSTAIVNGQPQPISGVACLQADGSWRIVR